MKDVSPEEVRLNDYALKSHVPDFTFSGDRDLASIDIRKEVTSLRNKLGRIKLHGRQQV